MSRTMHLEMPLTGDLAKFRLPPGVQKRLQKLLDQQEHGLTLDAEERREAEGLVEMAEWLSLLRLQAERLSKRSA
jgi:hypothetical protein